MKISEKIRGFVSFVYVYIYIYSFIYFAIVKSNILFSTRVRCEMIKKNGYRLHDCSDDNK